MSAFFFVLLASASASAETFSDRHGKKAADTSTFSGRHRAGQTAGGASPDSKTAWHGAAFGEGPLEDMRCDKPEPALPALLECVRPDDAGDRGVGELEAKVVVYRYWEGDLVEVQAEFPDADAGAVVLRALGLKYGKPVVAGAYPAWEGSVRHILTRARGQGVAVTYVDVSARADLYDALAEAGVDPAAKAAADL